MTIELTLTNVVTILSLFLMALWTLLKVIGAQQEKRLTEKFLVLNQAIGSIGTDLRAEADATRELERSFLQFKAQIAMDYVRREDFVRSVGIIEARIDNFALRMERTLEKIGAKL